MRYISTRAGAGVPAGFSDILLAGLAADGGLYLPAEYPKLTDGRLTGFRRALQTEGYAGLARQVVGLFIDDIDQADLAAICRRAYTADRFGDPRIVSAERVGDGRIWLGHISNGPTAAFKDMAMQLLGGLFAHELARRDTTLTILGATSGDTGSAAEYALRGQPRIRVHMLTPAGRMTPFQQAQMFSLPDANIHNIAVDGVFDDCQDLVKTVNADVEFKTRYHIGAVNSINWARLVAQVVYYVALWVQTTGSNDQQVSFAVPSGNFGNICAGHVARQMGLPIDALILATNENRVLHEFFDTGRYRVRSAAEVPATSSPSMDISKASNFERFVFDLLGRDGRRVADLFGGQLNSRGEFDLSGTAEFARLAADFGFRSGSSTHADRVATIADWYRSHRILIDPHTADAAHVAESFLDRVSTPIVVLETALPVKFAQTIAEAIGEVPPLPARFAGLEQAPRRVVNLPNDVQAIKDHIAAQAG